MIVDTVDKESRSRIMSRIRGKNTTIEMKLRSLLHANGYRFRLHYGKVVGHPDLYLPKYHTAVFINGCFWHRHENCKLAGSPKSNTEFWNRKFENNIRRDRRTYELINKDSIKVIVVWECTIRAMKKDDDIEEFLEKFKVAINNEEMYVEL